MAMNLTGQEAAEIMATRRAAKEKMRPQAPIKDGNGKIHQPTKLPHTAFRQDGQTWRRFGVVVPDSLWELAMNADDDFFGNYAQYAHLCDEVTLWNTSQTKMARGIVRGVDHVTNKVRIQVIEQHEFEPPTLGKDNPDDMYFAKDGGFDGFSIVRRADGAVIKSGIMGGIQKAREEIRSLHVTHGG